MVQGWDVVADRVALDWQPFVAALLDACPTQRVESVYVARPLPEELRRLIQGQPERESWRGQRGELWIATDTALIVMTVAVDDDGQQSAVADYTAWTDVRDVELRTRLSLAVNDIFAEHELTIQVPRLSAFDTHKEHRLGSFVASVLAHVNN